MAVIVEMQNTGDPRVRMEVLAMIEHVLSGRPGEWRVSIIGSRENDNWEMKIEGPKGFQRTIHPGRRGRRAPAERNPPLTPQAVTGELMRLPMKFEGNVT
jgi:hypothetical protein